MFPGAARLAEARGLRERARVSACFLAACYTYVTRTCGAWSGLSLTAGERGGVGEAGSGVTLSPRRPWPLSRGSEAWPPCR